MISFLIIHPLGVKAGRRRHLPSLSISHFPKSASREGHPLLLHLGLLLLLPQPGPQLPEPEAGDHLVHVLRPLRQQHVLRLGHEAGGEDPHQAEQGEDDEGAGLVDGALEGGGGK